MKTNVFTKGNIENGAIIFIHGNSLSAHSFRAQFELLENIPLIAIDLPGHGLSAPAENPEEVYCIPGYVEAIKQLVKEFGLQNFILAGHSLGGHIAIEAAEELEGIKGLMIWGTPPLGIPPDMANAFHPHAALPFLFQKELNDEQVHHLASSFFSKHNVAYEALVNKAAQQIKQADGNARLYLQHSVGIGRHKNETAIANKLSIPIAVLHGEEDPFINLKYLQNMQIPSLWKNKIQLIGKVSHHSHEETPQAFAELLKAFYADCN